MVKKHKHRWVAMRYPASRYLEKCSCGKRREKHFGRDGAYYRYPKAGEIKKKRKSDSDQLKPYTFGEAKGHKGFPW